MKIDIFSHICPPKFIDAFSKAGVSWEKVAGTVLVTGKPTLWDVDQRIEVMSRFEDYVQVLVPSAQVVEAYFNPEKAAYLAGVFNDEVAEIVNKHPDKFVGAVAALPLNNVDATLKEIDRAINKLGFKGILLDTPLFIHQEGRAFDLGFNYETMKAIDSPEYMPIYEAMAKYDLPIWIHPVGFGGVPVYSGEKRGIHLLATVFGWPIDSAMAMSRLVFSGVLARYPNLKFIIHHCGSGIVPALGGRMEDIFDKFRSLGVLKWTRSDQEDPFKLKSAVDYFRMFYADTALYGDSSGLMCGRDFFGSENIIFGTDFPFDALSGDKFTRKTIEAVYKMNISDGERKLIFEDNARRILRLNS